MRMPQIRPAMSARGRAGGRVRAVTAAGRGGRGLGRPGVGGTGRGAPFPGRGVTVTVIPSGSTASALPTTPGGTLFQVYVSGGVLITC